MRRSLPILAAACLGVLARPIPSAGQEQPAPDPKNDPVLNDPSVQERADEIRRRPAAPEGVAPTQTPSAEPRAKPSEGLAPNDFAVRQAPLRREGTFLVRQRGSLVRLDSGDAAFVFHRDASGRTERPMILIQSQNLARLEQLAADSGEDAAFHVTGQVFVYRDRNYLLLTVPPVPAGQPAAAPEAPKDPEEGTRPGDAEPTTAELIRALEVQRERPRSLGIPPVTNESAASSARPGSQAQDADPEGTIITRRRARLGRLSDGSTAAVFDNDADSSPSIDRPLALAPSLNSERMEFLASTRPEGLEFEISGRVLQYKGRNLLLPVMFRIHPSGGLNRRQ